MSRYSIYLVDCVRCGHSTSKAYARAHDGACKACVTGVIPADLLCPDCHAHRLSTYQRAHGYHCDACTREADPQGYLNEVMGYNE